MKPISYARHRFPPEVIRHAVIDPPPLNWSTLRYVFGHEKEDLDAEKAPQA
jgi:hypothetical protein